MKGVVLKELGLRMSEESMCLKASIHEFDYNSSWAWRKGLNPSLDCKNCL